MVKLCIAIVAKNEESNIEKCISSARLLKNVPITLIDSGSKDKTCDIASKLDVPVLQFDWNECYPKKRQWYLNKLAAESEFDWVLFLDADEYVTMSLASEIFEVIKSNASIGFIKKHMYYENKRIKYGGFDFYAGMLLRIKNCKFEALDDSSFKAYDMEIHERILFQGPCKYLKKGVNHEDFKGMENFLQKHLNYAVWDATVRSSAYGGHAIKPSLFGNTQERRRYLKKIVMTSPLEPFIWFLYHYVVKLGFLEGRRGYLLSLIRMSYIIQARALTYAKTHK